ncbi:Mis12-Mtw1 protein, putative [Cordyceps militaris CM01]|uniref:Mis12-Mtw1 protein, putative n=1 Tax=Cordyceps militaris (strain CM01) TaxID=983644 RepID=G3JTI5_CORMM|nr:Mis12-Mtw1 protein, putative [Cordyceps militaris CM01]EGX87989.1 Mis12-Mtw1 protein, putative [Cordyceps militaris CM01]
MTTLVAIRTLPLDLSMSKQPDRRTGKRLAGEQSPARRVATTTVMLTREDAAAAEDLEDDDGFVFTRKAKKQRTDEVAAAAAAPPVRRSPRNKPVATESGTTTTTTTTHKKPMAAPSPSRDADRRRREAKAARATTAADDRKPSRRDGNANKDAEPSRDSLPSPPRGTTTIALPTSDTPVIDRNKAMRKKAAEGDGGAGASPRSLSSGSNGSNGSKNHRRSSLGTRGRRASTLIESGQTALPHRDLDAQDFYKHIASEGLPEPLRMKQLLTWCGERALPAKPKQGVPSTDPSLGARAILDELLKEFSTRPEFTNWLARDESVAPAARVLRPNPRNIELDKKRASLEARIQSPNYPPPSPSSSPALPAIDLLDADEGRIHRYLAAELAPAAQARAQALTRLQAVQATLEWEADQLADGVHKLAQRVRVAGRQADAVLRAAAARLKRREDRERTAAGTKEMPLMEVLRSLGRLLPERGGGPDV